MKISDYLALSKHLNNCVACGSDLLGEGYGSLSVEGDTIKRSCECGFEFEYDANNGTTPKKIKAAVQAALDERIRELN